MANSKPKLKPTSTGKSNNDVRRRTRRACDRCKFKKAKCDGTSNCKTCQAVGSECKYTLPRGRDARNYYCQMRNVTETALQKLYWACRTKSDFPGDIPDESTGAVTTMAILKGLHLIDEPRSSQESHHLNSAPTKPIQIQPAPSSSPIKPLAGADHIREGHPASTAPALDVSQEAADNQTPSPRTVASLELVTPPEPDTAEQFAANNSPPLMRPDMKVVDSHTEAFRSERHRDSDIDVDSFLDMSSCTIPMDAQPPQNFLPLGQFSIRPMTQMRLAPHLPGGQISQESVGDAFLSPWPGSYAAAYQSVMN
ncbi:uncharacterized protein Z518_10050 [Rhinocladiella mackenziei CBS 650.93]|uniref:Zn(2)-C6 fungal-type domain-containing protein n=1 Tax=Rhinocladiella mackenziei CBS 650.93 TaxID=1442369 RepID=A0A0D2I5A2_9EURO|nr:uncharacterized protein Z518_10050 [Rhinocladiella mackenziei CBS 650.93]KIX00984.1 hypothetical protein Z518_10050 [Rhinocladiella mackenziei CBS 650.93]